MQWQIEWGEYYEKVNAAGGKIKDPPKLSPRQSAINCCRFDLKGDRNMNGDIPFTAIITWGIFHRIPKDRIEFYWNAIQTAEILISQWQQQRRNSRH